VDLINNASILVIPRWVRATVLSILGLLALLYLITSAIGIIDNTRSGWIEAGTYILGILLPFLLIGMIVSYSHSGVDALVARSAYFLSDSIPSLTVMFCEPADNFRNAFTRGDAKARSMPKVRVQSAPNMSIANYVVTAASLSEAKPGEPVTQRKVVFRIELNATKANVNILFARKLLVTKPAPEELFPHSIDGARHEGYWFASGYTPRHLDGTDYEAIVAVKRLDTDFLSNPIRRLDFGQDLILMLRAMLSERPELFEPAGTMG
jgi:hypothetical protein